MRVGWAGMDTPPGSGGGGVCFVYINKVLFLTLQRNTLLETAHSASPTNRDIDVNVNSKQVNLALTVVPEHEFTPGVIGCVVAGKMPWVKHRRDREEAEFCQRIPACQRHEKRLSAKTV